MRLEIEDLREENKQIREELLNAIGQWKASITSETEPLYDTLDDEGNIVPEPPRGRGGHVTFSAGGGTVDISSGINRKRPKHNSLMWKDKLFAALHILQFLVVAAAVAAIFIQIQDLRKKEDTLETRLKGFSLQPRELSVVTSDTALQVTLHCKLDYTHSCFLHTVAPTISPSPSYSTQWDHPSPSSSIR